MLPEALRRLGKRLLFRRDANSQWEAIHERNTGHAIGAWPERAAMAVELLHGLKLGTRPVLADLGCGRQTVRSLLPPGWVYVPVDRLSRSADTIVCDLDRELPDLHCDVIFCLGVLEYLKEPLQLLRHVYSRSRYFVFSYKGVAAHERNQRQGWVNNFSFMSLKRELTRAGAEFLRQSDGARGTRLFLYRGSGKRSGRSV
jgi:hypothetical protein